MIQLSEMQLECCRKALSWYKLEPSRRKPFFRIDGNAGSGKTTLIDYIIKTLPEDVRCRVEYVAPTGKAALVMRQKGCFGARTVHKAIFNPAGEKTGDKELLKKLQAEQEARIAQLVGIIEDDNRLIWSDKEVLRLQRLIDEQEALCQPLWKLNPDSTLKQAKLIVLSEASMVPDDMAEGLLSFKVPILLEGDPSQLPPVFGKAFFMKGKPDFHLSEVFRQRNGSPILDLARKARMGTPLRLGDYGEGCAVVESVDYETALAADQIIVGRNATRHAKNDKARRARGFVSQADATSSGYFLPRAGEKLICLRNDNELGLMNGELFRCESSEQISDHKVNLVVKSEYDGGIIDCIAHAELLRGAAQKSLPAWALRQKGVQQFDYGYAITCHKAQGSQWDFVIVYDESRDMGDFRAWLYTAITRAAKRVIIVRSKK